MEIQIGQQVRVYRNLHRGMFSVQIRTPTGWRVAGHVNEIHLTNVTFKVLQAGRMRVLAEQRKNVHAFVIGTVHCIGTCTCPLVADEKISYNPYKYSTFTINNMPLDTAQLDNVLLTDGTMYTLTHKEQT